MKIIFCVMITCRMVERRQWRFHRHGKKVLCYLIIWYIAGVRRSVISNWFLKEVGLVGGWGWGSRLDFSVSE
jgi:hypothetical protein